MTTETIKPKLLYQRQLSEELVLMSGFHEALLKARRASPNLNNHNQFLIANSLFSAEILNQHSDIASLSAHTSLNKSSLYLTLDRMLDKKLITYYFLKNDNKRKYVKMGLSLENQYIKLMKDTHSFSEMISKKST